MNTVSRPNPFDLFKDSYLILAKNLKLRKSTLLLSKNPQDSQLFLHNLINDYNTRSTYLGSQKDNFIFIDFSIFTEQSLESLDRELVDAVSEKVGVKFSNLEAVRDFLIKNDKVLLVSFETTGNVNPRYILSYKYVFGENIVFNCISDKRDLFFDEVIEVMFSEEFIKAYAAGLLKNLRIDLKDEEVVKKIAAGINKAEEVITESVSQPQGAREHIKEEPSQDIEKPNVPVKTATVEEDVRELVDIRPVEKPVIKKSQTFELSGSLRSSKEPVNLTEREQQIYNVLKEKNFISRQKIAEIAWGKDSAKSASDDAIDQVISRLRKKFVNAGYDRRYISSRKGEGVVLSSSSH